MAKFAAPFGCPAQRLDFSRSGLISARAAVGCNPLSGLEHSANLGLKCRNSIANDIPYQFEVNSDVVVNEAIAHAGQRGIAAGRL